MKTQKLTLEDKIGYGILVWILITYVLAIPILRGAYQDNKAWPNGDKMGYISIALAEIFAPVWITPLYIGKLIVIGSDKSQIEGDVKSIACYSPDGTGPVYQGCEGALAKVKCYSQAKRNGDSIEIKCPFF